MPRALLDVLRLLALGAYVGWLAWLGFRSRVGFASWHMFARSARCQFELAHADGTPFNPWLHLPHTCLAIDRFALEVLLVYERRVHKARLTGVVHLHENNGVTTLRVEETHVVA